MSRFNIIVAVDFKNGIGKNNTIPWKNSEDMKHFKNITTGTTIIMGRRTFESIGKPLPNRINIIVSSSEIRKVFVIGGEQLYREALDKYHYLCDNIYVSRIFGDYECDRFYPVLNYDYKQEIYNSNSLTIDICKFNKQHPEQQYLDLLRNVLINGETREDRTNIGTKSIFGTSMTFDLREGFPLITTKKTWFKGILAELLFFISGKTDTKILEKQGVNFWKGNTSKEYLAKHNLNYEESDMGPGYGHQWRHYGEKYIDCNTSYKGLDQLQTLIDSIKTDPYSRRHILTAWNPLDVNKMALPPCHCFVQFYVSSDNNLDCSLYQRSGDLFLGVPFNIASYSLLLLIVAKLCNLTARKFIHNIGDTHIYLNHIEQVKEQLKRVPYPLPRVEIGNIESIDNVSSNDINLVDYKSWSKINGDMAI